MPSVSSTASAKRKRSMPAFYAVREGRTPGVYHSWSDCQEQISKFPGAVYKKFDRLTDAEAFISGAAPSNKTPRTTPAPVARPSTSGGDKFYGVQVGHHPGVYTDYAQVQEQVRGFRGSKQQRFSTREEAQAFVDAGNGGTPGTTPAYTSGYNTTAASIKEEQGIDGSDMLALQRTPKARESGVKKQKRNDGLPVVTLENGDIEPGTGPLPEDAEDGFDRTIILRPDTGAVEKKSEAELNARKWQPTGELTGKLTIYTDGASRGNGQVGAYAGIGVYFGPNNPNNVAAPLGEGRQTNQRAELAAIKRAVDLAPIDRPVHIISDSNYAINCVTIWFQKWRQNDWKGSTGKNVDNRDLIEPILDRINERKLARADTTFEWVRGHANDAGNIAADQLAVAGAERGKREALEKEREEEEAKRRQRAMAVQDQEDAEWGWIKDLKKKEEQERLEREAAA